MLITVTMNEAELRDAISAWLVMRKMKLVTTRTGISVEGGPVEHGEASSLTVKFEAEPILHQDPQR